MDKNTITGLVLIGILLVGFSFLSRPSEEQIAAQKKYYDSIAVVQQQEEALKAKTEAALANSQKEVASAADSSALFFNALHGTDSKISIQNNVAEITFATKRRTCLFSHAERLYGTGQKDAGHAVRR